MLIIVILLALIAWVVLYQKNLKNKKDELLLKRKKLEDHGKKLLPHLSKYDYHPCSICGKKTFSILNISPAGRSMYVKCEYCEEKTHFKSLPKSDLEKVLRWWESTLKQKEELNRTAVYEEFFVVFSFDSECQNSKNHSTSRQIPEFKTYYSSESDLNSEQFVFFKKLERNLDQEIYCDVDNNISYLFVYLKNLLSKWDQISLDALRKKLIRISKLYHKEKSFSDYCLHLSLDCLLGQKKYLEYLKETESTHVYNLNRYAGMRLNIQRILKLPANPIDLVNLTASENRKTRFIIENEACYKKKLSMVFAEVETTNRNWFEILREWNPKIHRENKSLKDLILQEAKDSGEEVSIIDVGENKEQIILVDKKNNCKTVVDVEKEDEREIDNQPLFNTFGISPSPMLGFKEISYRSGKCIENIRNLARDAENRAREEMGVPKIGEGWVSETILFRKLEAAFPKTKVIHHGRPKWLGKQHFDIWFPRWKIAIEYHGKQHFEPVEFFGGEDAFKENVKRDKRKALIAKDNGVILFVVTENYDLDKLLKNIRDAIAMN